MPQLPTMPAQMESGMAGGAPPMGMAPPPMDPMAMGGAPMGGASQFPSTDPMAVILGLAGQQQADQAALAQQQVEALQMALSALVMQSQALPDPAAAAAMTEGGPVMAGPGPEGY